MQSLDRAHNEIMEVVGIRAAYFRLDRAVDTMQDANQHHKLYVDDCAALKGHVAEPAFDIG